MCFTDEVHFSQVHCLMVELGKHLAVSVGSMHNTFVLSREKVAHRK